MSSNTFTQTLPTLSCIQSFSILSTILIISIFIIICFLIMCISNFSLLYNLISIYEPFSQSNSSSYLSTQNKTLSNITSGESLKESPTESFEKISKKSSKESFEEISRESPTESFEEISEKSSKESFEEISRESSEESFEEISRESSKESFEEISRESPTESFEEISEKSSKESFDEISEKSSKESFEEISEKSSKESFEEISREPSKESFEEISEKSSEELLEKSSEESSEELLEESSEESSEELLEESPEELLEESLEGSYESKLDTRPLNIKLDREEILLTNAELIEQREIYEQPDPLDTFRYNDYNCQQGDKKKDTPKELKCENSSIMDRYYQGINVPDYDKTDDITSYYRKIRLPRTYLEDPDRHSFNYGSYSGYSTPYEIGSSLFQKYDQLPVSSNFAFPYTPAYGSRHKWNSQNHFTKIKYLKSKMMPPIKKVN